MWPYWLMFVLPAWAAVQESVRRTPVRLQGALSASRVPLGWWAVMVVITLLVGWRHEVGGDWFNYLNNFEDGFYDDVDWWASDPGYRLLEWIAIETNTGIYGVNLIAAAFFSFGLVRFCSHLPRPWLALSVAVPYLVIILGMGYSRQGIALGCIMAGLVALGNGRVAPFVIWAVLGATFHKTAVLLLPIAALAASRRRLTTAAWVAVVVATAYTVLLQDSVEALKANYIDAEYESEGALVRLLMNALPAALLLWKRERFAISLPQGRLWFWFALASLGMVGVYFVSPSSTAVDRVGLYLLPLQLMVFSHLPEVLGNPRGSNRGGVALVLVYYAAVEFVWLNFANHAFAWIPYRFYPLDGLF